MYHTGNNGNGFGNLYGEIPVLEPETKSEKETQERSNFQTISQPIEKNKYPSSLKDFMEIIKEKYYNSLSDEEKKLYNSLTPEEQDWFLEIGTKEIGETLRVKLEGLINKTESNTRTLKIFNSKYNLFK